MRILMSAVLLMALTGAAAMSARAQQPPMAVATVVASTSNVGVTLVGRALALTAGRYEARMTIEKSGASGRTSSTQGGAVSLDAGGSADLATVTLSIAPGDRLSVDLVLSADGREVASNRLTLGAD